MSDLTVRRHGLTCLTGGLSGSGGVAVPDVVQAFLSYQRFRGFSERTIERRRWSLTLLAEHVAPRRVLECTPVDLEGWLGRWPAAQSRYSIRADVVALFRWARRRGMVDHDPTELVEPPRLPSRLPSPVSADDVRRLISGTSGAPRRAVMLAAMAGLRVSEIAALDARDVVDGVLVVRDGKGSKDRAVPVSPELGRVLAPITAGPIVPASTGGAVGAMIRRAMRAHGITARPHDLRHSFATEVARAAGGNLIVLQQLMGHASLTTTQRYVRLIPAGGDLVADLYRSA